MSTDTPTYTTIRDDILRCLNRSNISVLTYTCRDLLERYTRAETLPSVGIQAVLQMLNQNFMTRGGEGSFSQIT